MRYVIAFTVYWTIAGIIWFFIYAEEMGQNVTTHRRNIPPYMPLFAVTIAVRALIDNSVWMYNHSVLSVYARWFRGEKPPAAAPYADINVALRREVLIYTTTGIVTASNKMKDESIIRTITPSHHYYPYNLAPTATDSTHSHRPRTHSGRFRSAGIRPVHHLSRPYVFRHLRHTWVHQ